MDFYYIFSHFNSSFAFIFAPPWSVGPCPWWCLVLSSYRSRLLLFIILMTHTGELIITSRPLRRAID